MSKKFIAVTFLSLAITSNLAAHGVCGETKLHGYMVDIKDELQLMSADVKAGDNDAASKHVNTLISLFEKANKTSPYQFMAKNLTGEELAQQTAQYKQSIDEVIRTLYDLDTALKNNDSNEIRKLFGKMGSHRNAGHKAFKSNC